MHRPGLLAASLLLAGCLQPAPGPGDHVDAATIPRVGGRPVTDYAWSTLPAGPTPRTEVVVARSEHRVYVIGGFIVQNDQPVAVALTEVLDVRTGQWTRPADYPLPIHHTAAVESGGALYVFGGLVGNTFTATNLAFKLAPGSTQWSPIAPLPQPRGAHGAALLDGKVYLMGGVGLNNPATGGGHLATVDVYDIAADRWTTIDAPIPTPRDHTAAAAIGGKILVAAGDVRGHGVNTNATEAFDPATRTWTKLAPVPTLRGSIAAVAWHGHLVVLGGQNRTQTFREVEGSSLP